MLWKNRFTHAGDILRAFLFFTYYMSRWRQCFINDLKIGISIIAVVWCRLSQKHYAEVFHCHENKFPPACIFKCNSLKHFAKFKHNINTQRRCKKTYPRKQTDGEGRKKKEFNFHANEKEEERKVEKEFNFRTDKWYRQY